MTIEMPDIEHIVQIKKGLSATFRAEVASGGTPQVLSLNVEWNPAIPRRLNKAAMRRYREARNNFVAQLAAKLGTGPALVIE